MAITDWPASERHAAKSPRTGARNLSDAEILPVPARRHWAQECGGPGQRPVAAVWYLTRLCSAAAEFAAFRHGLAKYAQLQAATELARRALREELSNGSLFDFPNRSQRVAATEPRPPRA